MVVDDARVVDSKACQVESWLQIFRNRSEFWALPGCNVGESMELTLGGAFTGENGATRATDLLVQAKTLFKTPEPHGWSAGLVLGYTRHHDFDTDRPAFGDLYAYSPWSMLFRHDHVVVHANLGWLHENSPRKHHVTWGVGSETQLTQRVWTIAEGFGRNVQQLSFQAGVRVWLVPNRTQIDTTVGTRVDGTPRERWVSVGLRLLSSAFLP
jgi:hypothetical protein